MKDLLPILRYRMSLHWPLKTEIDYQNPTKDRTALNFHFRQLTYRTDHQ
jgi:hypothetical protein